MGNALSAEGCNCGFDGAGRKGPLFTSMGHWMPDLQPDVEPGGEKYDPVMQAALDHSLRRQATAATKLQAGVRGRLRQAREKTKSKAQ